jgi:anti-sigma factor RsiW
MTTANMTCEAFDAALPDYLEGTLDDSARASVERHLSECLPCSALLRDLENIRKEAATLPDLVPSRDLWQGIEARIAAPVIPLATRPDRQRRFAPAWMGVAAAALIVTTAGITYTLTSRSVRSRQTAPIAQTVTPESPTQAVATADSSNPAGAAESVDVGGVSTQRSGGNSRVAQNDAQIRRVSPRATLASQIIADREHSEIVYGKEIDMLQKIVSQRKTQLDSATIAIIEKNLQIIDAAIEQSRAALARDPASQLLGQQLTHALDKKVELLRTAVMLPAST